MTFGSLIHVLFTLLILAGATVPSLAREYSFKTFDGPDDPSMVGGFALIQDSRGIIWVGGNNGAAWYDGSHWHSLRTRDGLPSNLCFTIEEAPSGDIYFGTQAGLAILHPRDDSIVVPEATRGKGVWALHFTDHGCLAGTEDGLLFLRGKAGYTIPLIDSVNRVPLRSHVYHIFADRKTRKLWIATNKYGPFSLDLDAFLPLIAFADTTLQREYETVGRAEFEKRHPGVLASPDHYAISDSSERMRRTLAAIHRYDHRDQFGNWWTGNFLNDKQGHLLVRAGDGIYRFTGTRFALIDRPYKGLMNTLRFIRSDDNSNIMASGKDGLVIERDSDTLYFNRENGLPRNEIQRTLQDREGNWWFLDSDGYVSKLSTPAVHIFSRNEDRHLEDLRQILPLDDGSTLLGGFQGIVRYAGGRIDSFPVQSTPHNLFKHMAVDARGNVLLLLAKSMYVVNPRTRRARLLKHLDTPHRRDLLPVVKDSANVLWFIHGRDLYSWDGSRLKTYPWLHRFIAYESEVKLVTRDGGLYFGPMFNPGLFRFKDNHLWVFRPDSLVYYPDPRHDPEACSRVRLFTPEEKEALILCQNGNQGPNGDLWFDTAKRGLVRLRNDSLRVFDIDGDHHFQTLHFLGRDSMACLYYAGQGHVYRVTRAGIRPFPVESLPDSRIRDMTSDGEGRHYFATNRGLFIDDSTRHFFLDKNFGLHETISDGVLFNNGKVFVLQSNGFYVFDPHALFDRNDVDIHPSIVGLMTDTTRLALADTLVMPLGRRNLTVHFMLANYFNEKNNRFSWKLSGLNNEFTERSSNHRAVFNRIPAGVYTFQLEAWDGLGNHSSIDHPMVIVVPPYFFEQVWFRALVALVFFAAILLLFRWRTWRIQRLNRNLDEQVNRRTLELQIRTRELQEKTTELEAALIELEKSKQSEIEAERLRSVREMAAAVAHEFNNPMAVLAAVADLCKMKEVSETDKRKQVAKIPPVVERMQNLVTRLLRITHVRQKHYAGGVNIVDIKESAGGEEDDAGPQDGE